MSTAKIQQTSAELNRLAAVADGLQKRYTAHLMLYEAACLARSDQEIAQRREECHTLLDAILDNSRDVSFRGLELRKLMEG